MTLRVTLNRTTHEWEETIDFQLHSGTEILLDASQFAAKATAEFDASDSAETSAEIVALETEIDNLQAKTLAVYQQALEANPGEAAIQSKITDIEALSGEIEDALP